MSRRRVDIVDYQHRDRKPGRPWETECLDATNVLALTMVVPSALGCETAATGSRVALCKWNRRGNAVWRTQ